MYTCYSLFMSKLLLTLIVCLISFEARTNQIVSQLKCNGKLEGVTIDSRADNKSTVDSISDNGDIFITFYDDELKGKEPTLNFKWGSEDRKVKFLPFGKNLNAIHFDGNTKMDRDGYNFRDYHLNIDKNTLYFTRTTVRGLFGSPPFSTTSSVYFTKCKILKK